MGDMEKSGGCSGGMDGDNEVLGSGGLAPQSVTEKGIPDADNATPDGMSRAVTSGTSDQTPPLTSREESVERAEAGPSPASRKTRYDESRRMGDKNAGRTTDIGDA
ncbi:MAG: hypothetical protein LUC93_02640 [Planctomycetaceae bacterium]|nr:hypothetical protein [Planctomycetaceae bacterium]